MDNLIIHPLNSNSNDKTTLDEEVDIFPKYRTIPVLKSCDSTQSPVRYYENMSCGKEVRNGKNENGGGIFGDGLQSKVSRTSNKKRAKPDSVMHMNPLQFKHRSNLSFFERMGQGSLSEPTLCNAKDRGDSITLQDICAENEFFANKRGNAPKYGSSKNQGVKGCIYVKSNGKLFKSIIETKSLQFEDDTRCGLLGRNDRNRVPQHVGDSPAKSNFLRFASKERRSIKEEPDDDFEIAIFLSGIKNLAEKNSRKQKVLVTRKKKSETRLKQDKRVKRKKKRNDAAFIFGKRFATLQESYQDSSNLLTVSHYDAEKNFCGEQRRPSKWLPDFSSESEREHEAQNGMKCKKRKPQKCLGNTSEVRSHTLFDNGDQSMRFSLGSEKKHDMTDRSKGMSASSFCHFSDEFKISTSKIRDHVLWAKFESIFKKYASTTRHSGEVIPRKISTEWMTRAGVVDVILTENEADEAFRQAVGVKITMNAQEYKEFLIMLTLRMKLPYYEIYRRMCGI